MLFSKIIPNKTLPRSQLPCNYPHLTITSSLSPLFSLSTSPFIVPQRSVSNRKLSFLFIYLFFPSRRFLFLWVMTDSAEPPSESAAEPNPNPNPIPNSHIHPRREPFEHGLLPIPKLIFTDPTQTLTQLRQKLVSHPRVNSATLADTLQISVDHARLVLDTLASVLHSETDPLVKAPPGEIDSVGADLRDLILFLYIQSYKRLLPRTHKDSAAVTDVWPSTSAFDGFLSALSPLQVIFVFWAFNWFICENVSILGVNCLSWCLNWYILI